MITNCIGLVFIAWVSYLVFSLSKCKNFKINLLILSIIVTVILSLLLQIFLFTETHQRLSHDIVNKDNKYGLLWGTTACVLYLCMHLTALINLNLWGHYYILIQMHASMSRNKLGMMEGKVQAKYDFRKNVLNISTLILMATVCGNLWYKL